MAHESKPSVHAPLSHQTSLAEQIQRQNDYGFQDSNYRALNPKMGSSERRAL